MKQHDLAQFYWTIPIVAEVSKWPRVNNCDKTYDQGLYAQWVGFARDILLGNWNKGFLYFYIKTIRFIYKNYIEDKSVRNRQLYTAYGTKAHKIVFTKSNGHVYTGLTTILKCPVWTKTGARILWLELHILLLAGC